MCIDYEDVIEESSSKVGKEKTNKRNPEAKKLVGSLQGARCKLELLVDVETRGGHGRRGRVHI